MQYRASNTPEGVNSELMSAADQGGRREWQGSGLTEWVNEVASEWVQRHFSNNRRAFMKTTMTVMMMVLFTCFLVANAPVSAEPTGSSTMGGGSMPSPEKIPQDKHTDLTGGQQGVPDEYATTPVRQGKLKEVSDSKLLNQTVTNPQGEKLGKITKVLKDETTQNIEYIMFQPQDSQSARPLPWSKFQEKGDKIVLNATKEELRPNVSSKDAKDMSPDLALFMDEIEQKRNEPKGAGGGNERPSGDPGSLSGAATMGEDKVGSTRSAPPTPAPQFENDAQKGKK
jgi:sporulation protein YlmC with PRC-barrel domain